ncbi:hypothetical protein [Armatimonas rosea]|uniref:Uncharacterized protein n=1 Tax=Armatimonas rosea TaxID=685828 RepID=A0A7W9W7T6_ARMRO|nr:hypothetical protein [Armatimonas rosea]MBB6052804.1 hypothetical protein [Armatimonas rosea]
MRNADKKTQAVERAFAAELQKHVERDDLTALLTFFAASLAAERSEQFRRFWTKVLALLGLALLFALFSDFSFKDSLEQAIAFALIPALGLYTVTRPNSTPRYPLLLKAATNILLVPRSYTPEQKKRIVQIAQAVSGPETDAAALLRETCTKVLQRSA